MSTVWHIPSSMLNQEGKEVKRFAAIYSEPVGVYGAYALDYCHGHFLFDALFAGNPVEK